MKKRWYDYLWIVSLTYLILGFFNILFAWLGLLCFFIPLIISTAAEDNFSACWADGSASPEKRTFPGG